MSYKKIFNLKNYPWLLYLRNIKMSLSEEQQNCKKYWTQMENIYDPWAGSGLGTGGVVVIILSALLLLALSSWWFTTPQETTSINAENASSIVANAVNPMVANLQVPLVETIPSKEEWSFFGEIRKKLFYKLS